MIYLAVPPDSPIDQGDLIDGCPVVVVKALTADPASPDARFEPQRIVVLTQTCDLANDKTTVVTS